jgi:hypothetical protein
MDPKGKWMVINDKEKETQYVDEPKGDKPTDSGLSHKKKDGKKKRRIKKIIYYDSDASSSSPRDNDDDSSTKKKKINQNYSFDYSRMLYNSNAHKMRRMSRGRHRPLDFLGSRRPQKSLRCSPRPRLTLNQTL